VTVVASVLLLPAATLANDKYEPCPPLPPVAPASDIMRDAGVLAALADVKSLLREKAATLPSGLVATIVYDQETLWSGGFGKRNKFDQGSPVPGPSDLVRIASITKVFTDILLFALRDAGVVSLDDPVRKYLPNLSLGKLGDTRGEITLRNLAAHLSGLPREVGWPVKLDAAHV
jgi:CubicO group peptidase (beta-lactamase class C family)